MRDMRIAHAAGDTAAYNRLLYGDEHGTQPDDALPDYLPHDALQDETDYLDQEAALERYAKYNYLTDTYGGGEDWT